MGLLQLNQLHLKGIPAYVIPTDVFAAMLSSQGVDADLQKLEMQLGGEAPREHLEAIRNTILAAPLPERLMPAIQAQIATWKTIYGSQVIIRSSATVEDNAHRSFAGIFESIPCETEEEIQKAIRRVWASVFSPRAFAYYGIASLKQFPAMALILQPFLEADRAGVMFTRFSDAEHQDKVLVEHVEGRGEKLVTGKINPERLWLPPHSASEDFPETGQLPEPIARELTQVAETLENALGPQDVEWCLLDNELYIVQTRPITTTNETALPLIEGEILLKGVAASQGRASGMVHLVFNIEDADTLQAGQVLTTTMTNPDMVPSMQRSAAVVTDVGGMICHAAIVSRELGIPCVVGTKSATQTLAQGNVVTVDGSTGVIFRGMVKVQSGPAQPKLQWTNLWQAWQKVTSPGELPLIPTYHALASMPSELTECVLEPFPDLALDPLVEITSLAGLDEAQSHTLAETYQNKLSQSAQKYAKTIYLDMHRLPENLKASLCEALAGNPHVVILTEQTEIGPWLIQTTPAGKTIAILNQFSSHFNEGPEAIQYAIPLGFGLLLSGGPIDPPSEPGDRPEGMFGMMPEIRMAPMPARARREAMHRLIPALSRAHGGQIPETDQVFPWLDLRPEVVISPYLKAFVTPGVESLPYVMGFPDPPLHIQFIRCRFHFRQDTLFGFFPKLMQMTWDEAFLANMLKQCRATYDQLEALSAKLPASEAELSVANDTQLTEQFVTWWNAFSEFFSLSFFIQAQGDDCVFPILGMMAGGHASLLKSIPIDAQIPGLAELSAPVTPVLTAEYIQDLLALNQALHWHEIQNVGAALTTLQEEVHPDLNSAFARVHERWHWMRERDPYYDPYDTPESILEKALAIRSSPPADYESNLTQANLAIALHFDLGRVSGAAEKIVYGVKYGRALAIDRENHHIVWLRASYRLRKILIEWERRLREKNEIQYRDIFFLTPWEILEAVANRTDPMPDDLLARLRNRRVAYEREIQLKAGKESPLTPEPEEDYY